MALFSTLHTSNRFLVSIEMNRPIRVGDIVFIIADDQEYSLNITDIQPTYIIAGDYVLIPEYERWMVRNYPKDHVVRFEAVPSLSEYAPEVMIKILLPLDYEDLMNACGADKRLNSICQDEYFWKLKVEHDYGMITQDKPSDITYRQQYIDLMTNNNPNKAATDGRLDILKSLALRGIHSNREAVNGAAIFGKLEVLKWLVQTRGIYPDQASVDLTEVKVRLMALFSLSRGELPSSVADVAVAGDELKVLEWLAQHNIYPTHGRYGA